jgi:aminopeptidase N
MGWYPNNNVPFDKATYSMRMTVPEGWSALATGVLQERTAGEDAQGRPTTSFVWDEPKLTASYLYSLTIGRYDLSSPEPAAPQMTAPTSPLNASVPFYTAVDTTFTTGKPTMLTTLGRVPSMMDFFADYYDQPYPFDSTGGIVPRQSVGYALETQGKPIYAGNGATQATHGGPTAGTVAHETAHHWFGNSATLERWKDIWLNEGMTEFSSWLWQEVANAGTTLDARFAANHTNQNDPEYWSLAPANPPTAVSIFAGQMYSRGAMTMLGMRAVLGDATFRSTMRRYLAENLYGTVTTEEFIALVKDVDPARADRWTEYFRQWLYGTVKPTMTKDNFDTFVLP